MAETLSWCNFKPFILCGDVDLFPEQFISLLVLSRRYPERRRKKPCSVHPGSVDLFVHIGINSDTFGPLA